MVFWFDRDFVVPEWGPQLFIVTYDTVTGNYIGIEKPICAIMAWMAIISLLISQFLGQGKRFWTASSGVVIMVCYWIWLAIRIWCSDFLFTSIPFLVAWPLMLFVIAKEARKGKR
jgi:hypothetical protein